MICIPGENDVYQNEAIAIQPLDASVRKAAYMPIPYPFILGSNVAGTIEAVGPGVEDFKVGEKVVSSTPTYVTKETKWGGWQKFVSSKPEMTAKVNLISRCSNSFSEWGTLDRRSQLRSSSSHLIPSVDSCFGIASICGNG